jgi:hypothetical protein
MTTTIIPAFDAQSPDAEILEAFELVRAGRAWSYREQDDLKREVPDEFDDKQFELEKGVTGNWATTPTGVAAQILLAITMDCSRWIDRGLVDQGVRALYLARKQLDGTEQQMVTAAYELLHIEWEQAVAEYEMSEAFFRTILDLQDLAIGGSEALTERLAKAENTFSDTTQVRRVLHTLAPDWDCYRRKAEIAMAEGLAAEAAPWLVRDVNFLTGAIRPDEQAEAAE